MGIGVLCFGLVFLKKRMCLVAFSSQLTSSVFYVTMRGQNQLFFLMKVSHNNISGMTVKKNNKISEVKYVKFAIPNIYYFILSYFAIVHESTNSGHSIKKAHMKQ